MYTGNTGNEKVQRSSGNIGKAFGTSTIHHSGKFRKRRQEQGETVAHFLDALKNLARDCDFKTTLDDNLRDTLVSGLKCEIIQERLFSEKDLRFTKAYELARNMEAAEKDVMFMDNTSKVKGQTEFKRPVQMNKVVVVVRAQSSLKMLDIREIMQCPTKSMRVFVVEEETPARVSVSKRILLATSVDRKGI
ncbi:unnamed protein product [Brassicogethes aeneus]|uniref:Uncharacterized protein n=1 Tax=Brassicogethes aeneus TaxID=1431903 RepID=A0A9P0AS06_BRAAE|nr:unnamed protein product [Brassicogethes aeneus]